MYLFACRVRCLRRGDARAYEELVRASGHQDADVRVVAEAFLEEIHDTERSKLIFAELAAHV